MFQSASKLSTVLEKSTMENSTTETPNALEHVHDTLRDRILSGELVPGQTVSQASLARELGVSRSPIREACRILEAEGLVESRANYRVRVTDLSVGDLEEIYASRIVLEALALTRRLPTLRTAELDQMAAALADMRVAAARRDYGEFTVPHDAFHSFLIVEVGLRLTNNLAKLNDHAQRYRRVYTTQTPMAWNLVVEQDERIFEAIRAGDTATARVELGMHLGATALATISLLNPMHDPVLVKAALGQIDCRPQEGHM
jgi:DNA-binding GntR family transcriptional regulator